jgi:hypothetical protein
LFTVHSILKELVEHGGVAVSQDQWSEKTSRCPLNSCVRQIHGHEKRMSLGLLLSPIELYELSPIFLIRSYAPVGAFRGRVRAQTIVLAEPLVDDRLRMLSRCKTFGVEDLTA